VRTPIAARQFSGVLMKAAAMSDFIDQLRAGRAQAHADAQSILERAKREGRSVLDQSEQRRLDAHLADMRGLAQRIAEAEADEQRAGAGNPTLARIRAATSQNGKPAMSSGMSVYEPATYQKGDTKVSYVQDLVKMSLNLDSTGEARSRLMRHAQDVAELPEYKEYRDLSRVDGSGGYAVPPAWLMDQYIELARPGRAFANICQRQPLPGGTDSINIPKILTGTSVGVQTADNQPVLDVDLSDTFINAPVRTISGQQGVAIQLIDQSPIAFDDLIFRDLVADYAAQVDRQVIGGSGINGQILGVTLTPGISIINVSTVDLQHVYSAVANAVQLVHTTRFLPPQVIVMHPRRWGWFLSLLDGQQRPLFLPAANNPQNAAGILSDVDSQQVVGQMHGLPVVTDPNITTTDGPGTSVGTNDVIYVLRASDLVLWETGIRARVLPETKAANLTVLLQAYGYLAFSAARYPQSVVEITGLTAPTF
jgi:HK97 family phage major capsid protein